MAMTALLSNVMSLPPKFDEVREAITDANYDLAFLTEAWLRDHQSSNAFSISGYNFFSPRSIERFTWGSMYLHQGFHQI